MDVYNFLDMLNQDDVVVFIYDISTEKEFRYEDKNEARYGGLEDYEVLSFDIEMKSVCERPQIVIILNIETDIDDE